MAQMKVFTLDRLTQYDGLIKGYIAAADAAIDAKSLKTVAISGNTLKFYNVEEPVGETAPKFEITLPQTDISGLLEKFNNATAGNIVVVGADGKVIADGGVALADVALKSEVEAVDAKAVKNAEDIAKNVTAIGEAKAAAEAAQGAADAAQGEVDALEEKVNGMYTNTQIDEAIEAAKTAATYDDEEVRGLISGLETKVNDNETDIEGKMTALTERVSANETAIAGNKSANEATQAEVDALEETVAGMYTNKQIDDAIAAAKTEATYDDTEIRGLISDNANAIQAHKDSVDGVVTTLVGDDTGKSVRTIANEELAKQLVAEGAAESLDTLEEIAAWIQSHPEDAAAMNKAIDDLEALVGTLPEGVTATTIVGYIAEAVAAEKARAEEVEGGLDERLQAVEGKVGEAVDTQIANKIAELDADVTSAEVEEGKGVRVQVVEVDGKVTSVAVTGNYDNAYDAKGAAATAESNAKAYAEECANGKDEAIAAAKKAGDDAAAAVTTLENGKVAENAAAIEELSGLVGEGMTPITSEEIEALFA